MGLLWWCNLISFELCYPLLIFFHPLTSWRSSLYQSKLEYITNILIFKMFVLRRHNQWEIFTFSWKVRDRNPSLMSLHICLPRSICFFAVKRFLGSLPKCLQLILNDQLNSPYKHLLEFCFPLDNALILVFSPSIHLMWLQILRAIIMFFLVFIYIIFFQQNHWTCSLTT